MSAGPAGAEEHHEVVIIGGGMAGVSCALECHDIQLDTMVLEMQTQLGGQIAEIPFHVRNVAAGAYDDEHPLPMALEQSAAILGDRARRGWPVDRIDLGGRGVEIGRPADRGGRHRDRHRSGAPAAVRGRRRGPWRRCDL